MGYSPQRFVQEVDPNLLCAVCGGVLEEAVLTPCGHTFCHLCLHTWLNGAQPTCCSCPECRSPVAPNVVKPVHALRNLVRGLVVACDNAERGCQEATKLDLLSHHLATACLYAPVQCAGCGEQVLRLDLATHQMSCAGIAASVRDDDDDYEGDGDDRKKETGDDDGELCRSVYIDEDYCSSSRGSDAEENVGASSANARASPDPAWRALRERLQLSKSGAGPVEVCLLLARIRSLEMRVERLLDELRAARLHSRQLERQYQRVGAELRHKESEVRQMCDAQVFLQQEAGRSPHSVARLSLLIARHLLHKPRYLNADDVFRAVRTCYQNFHLKGFVHESTSSSASEAGDGRRMMMTSTLGPGASAGRSTGDFWLVPAYESLTSSRQRESGTGRSPLTTHFRYGQSACDHDLHMLLATAYASNWFTADQRMTFQRWLTALTSRQPTAPLSLSSSSSAWPATSSDHSSGYFRPGSSLFNNR